MLRFAANLTMMFPEFAFLERFDAAARAGFRAVEFQFPYQFPSSVIRQRLEENGLQAVLHNIPAGNWEKGDRGLAGLPDRIEEFRDGVMKAIEYATDLNVSRLNCLAGIAPDCDDVCVWETLIANLNYAAVEAEKAGIRIMVEACNRYDVPEFLLNTSDSVIRAIDDAQHRNLWLQYDVYHMQRSEGELANTIRRLIPRIGHVQIADTPGRHEPGTGEINYAFILDTFDQLGYDGWISGEYNPTSSTPNGLAWCGL